jgi:hypothetical protein
MANILELLREKNYYLERFLEESKREKSRFKARHFDNLDNLYKMREQILLNIQSIDERISRICAHSEDSLLPSPTGGEMANLLDKIKLNVRAILEEDLQIISCIEDEKTKIIREISTTREGRKVLKGYRSI